MSILKIKMKKYFEKYPDYLPIWREKTKKKGFIIPAAVMFEFYDEGIRFGPEPPKRGIRLVSFLELLWKHYKALPDRKQYMSLPNRKEYMSLPLELRGDAYFALYEDIVKNDLEPNWKIKIRRKRHKNYKKI